MRTQHLRQLAFDILHDALLHTPAIQHTDPFPSPLFFWFANNRSSRRRLPPARSRPSSRTSRLRSRTLRMHDLSTSSPSTTSLPPVPRSAAPSTRWSRRASGPPQATTGSSAVSFFFTFQAALSRHARQCGCDSCLRCRMY